MDTVKVLIAEDKAEIRKALRAFLSRLPNVVVVGETNVDADAVAAASEVHPDVVLLDMGVPGWMSLVTARMIKEKAPSTKIFLSTIHDAKAYSDKANSIWIDGVISKLDLMAGLRGMVSAVSTATVSNELRGGTDTQYPL